MAAEITKNDWAVMERRAAMNEETRLIEACRQGDRDAFRQLFEAYKDRVWSIALHFSGDEVVARDVTQQVFLKLFTGIAQFRHEASFGTWLYRLVVSACMDEWRSRRRLISFDFFGARDARADGRNELSRNELSMMEDRLSKHQRREQATQEDCYTRLEISEAVKAAIKELKPKLRITILLKYFEELSYEEMARALGCSTGTVASRLNRGHKELARRLGHLRGVMRIED